LNFRDAGTDNLIYYMAACTFTEYPVLLHIPAWNA